MTPSQNQQCRSDTMTQPITFPMTEPEILDQDASIIFILKQKMKNSWYNGDRDGADDLVSSDKVCGDKVVL